MGLKNLRRGRIRQVFRRKIILKSRRKLDPDVQPLSADDPILKEFQVVNDDFIFWDAEGNVAIRFFKKKIPLKYCNNLVKSSRALKLAVGRPACRNTRSYHLGYWRRYRKRQFLSRDGMACCIKQGGRFFYNVLNMELFRIVDKLFKQTSKKLYQEYCDVETPGPRLVGKSFSMCVVNWGTTGPHYDHMDRPDGLCCVLPFGNFTGGDLVFRDEKIRIHFEKGNIIFFQSQKMLHENLPVIEGDRQSIVFCTDWNSFKTTK